MENFDIKRLEVGQMRTNCYLIINRKSGECAIVDPGDDAELIQRAIFEAELEPAMILATHGHFDHLMAATELKLAFDVPLYMHKADDFLLRRGEDSAEYFLGVTDYIAPQVDGYVKEGVEFVFDDFKIRVIETPGHTPGSISFYLEEVGVLLPGDLIFAGGGMGRTDFSYSSFWELELSLWKILDLPGEVAIFPGHGEETTISTERPYFSFLEEEFLVA